MKKIIAILLATVIFCASMSGVCFAEDVVFSDVPSSAWYCEDVYTAVSMGLVGGKGNGRYAPEDNLTYAEAIKLAACMHKLCHLGTAEFERTPVWYTPYVTYAETTGIKRRTYDLNAKITRADFLDIFSRALPANMMNEINRIADGNIPDVPMTYENAASIYKLYRVGIVAGSDDAHNCKPSTNIKRSEVATILVRMMDPSKRVKFELKLSNERARYNTGYGVYDEKLNEYYDAIIMEDYEFAAKYVDSSSVNLKMLYYARDGGQIEYALYDVNGDGIHELILLMGENVIDIYTTKDGILVKLFPNCTFGHDGYLNLLFDSLLLISRSNGAYAAEFTLYKMNNDASGVSKIGSVYHDESGEDPSKSGYEYVSFDEYIRRFSSYEANSIVGNLSRRTVADSIESSKEVHYNQGVKYFDEKDYLAAVKEFKLAGDYMNAQDLVFECYYILGNEQLNAGNVQQAGAYLGVCGTYKDAHNIMNEYYFELGNKKLNAGEVEEGIEYLRMCGTYKDAHNIINDYYYNDAQEALQQYADNYRGLDLTKLKECYNTAMQKFSLCKGYKDTDAILNQLDRSYKAKTVFNGKTGHDKATFAEATIEFEGRYMNITTHMFTARDGGSKLVVKYDGQTDTFTATWDGVSSSDYYNNSFYGTAWSDLIKSFTSISDVSNLKSSYIDDLSGYWSSPRADIFVYQRKYASYHIKTSVEAFPGVYKISIEVSK